MLRILVRCLPAACRRLRRSSRYGCTRDSKPDDLVRSRPRVPLISAMPSHCVVALLIPVAAAVVGVRALAQNPTADLEPIGISRTSRAASASDTGPARRASSDAAPDALTLMGTVTDASGVAVAAAVVALIGTQDSTATDGRGQFVLHELRAGAYVLSVRRLGFASQRLAVSVSAERAGRVTVTLTRMVPVLPTVTTTAEERRAYRDVGFDERSAGVGSFLTYEQIARKLSTLEKNDFVYLLANTLGWGQKRPNVQPKNSNCVSFWIDGRPQALGSPYFGTGSNAGTGLDPGMRVGTGSTGGIGPPPNYFPGGLLPGTDFFAGVIDAYDVGAIEYYEPPERPAQFGSSGCALVVIWTLTRLGLPMNAGGADDMATNDAPLVRGALTLASDAACILAAAADTMDSPISAVLGGVPSRPVAKKLWTAYADSVKAGIARWAVLPNELQLPTFGPAFMRDRDGSEQSANAGAGEVAPTVSSVFVFTLDSSGALTGARVAASALSGAADTSILAGLARAAEAHAFPTFPGGPSGAGSARFHLLVSSVEPAADTDAAVLGRMEVPVWPLARAAHPLADSTVAAFGPRTTDSATVQMVIDAQGRALAGTVRILNGPARTDRTSADSGYRQRLTQRLNQLRFEPAQIGNCPVPQLVTQSVVVPAGPAASQ
jgi:Carboxypeptidase regulatory-like domain